LLLRVAHKITNAVGHQWAVMVSALALMVATISIPFIGVNIVNYGISVATCWLVFVIQVTTNRESKALQLKIDELIKSIPEARDELAAMERKEGTLEQVEAEEHTGEKVGASGEPATDRREAVKAAR
jgi:low affinity Fe/Cu permease